MSSKTAVALGTTHGTRIGINADTGKTSGKNIASACTSNVTETIATRSRSRATSGIPRPVCTTRISKLTPVKSTIGYTELEKLVANKVLEMRNQVRRNTLSGIWSEITDDVHFKFRYSQKHKPPRSFPQL